MRENERERVSERENRERERKRERESLERECKNFAPRFANTKLIHQSLIGNAFKILIHRKKLSEKVSLECVVVEIENSCLLK